MLVFSWMGALIITVTLLGGTKILGSTGMEGNLQAIRIATVISIKAASPMQ